jgi:hypothetical protein
MNDLIVVEKIALTVALVKPSRGFCLNHAMNSSSAMLYTRFVIREETLSRTGAFNLCHCHLVHELTRGTITQIPGGRGL